MKKKAFIYVGHSNWGKSFALKQITDGSSHKKTIKIQNQWFWVRKMSNDDFSEGLLDFVRKITYNSYEYFILAYCPNHEGDHIAKSILDELKKQCDLCFFVQESKFSDPSMKITSQEISFLSKIGKVQILKGHHEDSTRANEFLKFINKIFEQSKV